MVSSIPTASEAQTALVKFEASWPDLQEGIVITDEDSYSYYTEKLKKLKGVAKELSALKHTMTGPIAAAKKAIEAHFADPEFRLNRAEGDIKRAIVSYERQLEEVRRLAEARARDEQKRLQDAAEERASKLRAKGREEQADAVVAAVPPVPIINSSHERTSGISLRSTWRAEVTNINELIASGRWEFIEVNDKFLQNFARSTKGMSPVPGIKFIEEKGVSARAE